MADKQGKAMTFGRKSSLSVRNLLGQMGRSSSSLISSSREGVAATTTITATTTTTNITAATPTTTATATTPLTNNPRSPPAPAPPPPPPPPPPPLLLPTPSSSSSYLAVAVPDNISTSTFTSTTPSASSSSSTSPPSSSSKSSTSASLSAASPSNPPKPLPPLPPLPPPPPDDLAPDYSQRPSTAPDQARRSKSELEDLVSGNSKSKRSVRKAPTLANLSDLNSGHTARRPSSSSPAVSSAGTFPLSVPASSRERRSSSSKRPPASFSANGIETSFGPPPALITRSSSYQTELARLVQSPVASACTAAQQNQTPQSQDPDPLASNQSQSSQPADSDSQQNKFLLAPAPTSRKKMNSLDAVVRDGSNWQQRLPPGHSYLTRDVSPPGSHRRPYRKSDEGMESSQSSEDLFLKLAEGKADEDATLRNDQIRGRVVADHFSNQGDLEPRNLRRNSSPAGSTLSSRYVSQDPIIQQKRRSGAASVVSTSNRRPSQSAEQKLNVYRHKYLTTGSPSVVSQSSGLGTTAQRRASATEQMIRSQTRSRLYPSEHSPKATRSSFQEPRADGAESVVSTVQSAVWDEIPASAESKSHTLQSHPPPTRQFHPSNGAAERPRTATTTITTVSSSPKFPMGLKSALLEGGKLLQGDSPSLLHPTLHQSLARCKPHINTTLCRALEKAAQDALDLAAYARTPSSPGGALPDRALRRKADNLCRNITDVCISLSETNSSPDATRTSTGVYAAGSTTRPGSRDPHFGVASGITNSPLEIKSAQNFAAPSSVASSGASQLFPRNTTEGLSVNPERPTPSRALERVEARRASLMANAQGGSLPPSPMTPNVSAPPQRQSLLHDTTKSSPITSSVPQSASGSGLLSRAGTSLSLLKTRRVTQNVQTPLHSTAYNQQQSLEDSGSNDGLRPPSRATTEIGTFGGTAQSRRRSDRFSAGLFTRREDGQQSTPPGPNVLRRVTGLGRDRNTGFSSPIVARREEETADGTDFLGVDDKKIKRRSLGLYSVGSNSGVGRKLSVGTRATTSAGLGVGAASGGLSVKRASLTAGAE